MKSYIIMGLTALTISLAALSNAHAGETTMSLSEKMDAYKEGKHGVYGKTPISDIGNIVYHNASRPWDGKTQDDPSHFQHKVVEGRYGGDVFVKNGSTWPMGRTWDGKTQDDTSHFGSQPQHAGMDMTNCMDMPCCKNMKMDKQKCETMMMKANMSEGKRELVKCADMPCCKNMAMDMQGCEKMMGK